MDNDTTIWYNDVVIRHLMQLITGAGDVSTLKTMSLLSHYHNALAQNYLQLLKGSRHDCQCDCRKMVQFKIYDEVRKWKYIGSAISLDSFTGGCWTKKKFDLAKFPVCDLCYWRHWHLTGFRTSEQCLRLCKD